MLIIKKTPTHHDRLALQHPPSRRRHRPARKHSPLSGIRGNTCDGGGYAKEFYLRLGQASFDVAILDIGLPDQSGFVLADYLRQNTDSGIIILTAHSAIQEKVQGYAAGADLYLVKPVDMEGLSAAIKSMALRRTGNLDEPRASPNLWLLDRSAWRLISPSGTSIMLTGKEYTFLSLLALADRKQLGRRELLEAMGYRDDAYVGRALDNIVLRIRNKIRDQTGMDDVIHTFHSVGFCFSAELQVR